MFRQTITKSRKQILKHIEDSNIEEEDTEKKQENHKVKKVKKQIKFREDLYSPKGICVKAGNILNIHLIENST